MSRCWFTGSIVNGVLVRKQCTLLKASREYQALSAMAGQGCQGVPQSRAPMTAREYSWLLKQGASQEEEQDHLFHNWQEG